MSSVKQKVHESCLALINGKIAALNKKLAELKEAKTQETKSSVGDKYETGRAMVQLEEEKAGKQLQEALQLKSLISSINPMSTNETIGLGSLVLADNGQFYLSAGLGKLNIEDENYYAISMQSPIGQALLGKKSGDEFHLKGQKIGIKSHH